MKQLVPICKAHFICSPMGRAASVKFLVRNSLLLLRSVQTELCNKLGFWLAPSHTCRHTWGSTTALLTLKNAQSKRQRKHTWPGHAVSSAELHTSNGKCRPWTKTLRRIQGCDKSSSRLQQHNWARFCHSPLPGNRLKLGWIRLESWLPTFTQHRWCLIKLLTVRNSPGNFSILGKRQSLSKISLSLAS